MLEGLVPCLVDLVIKNGSERKPGGKSRQGESPTDLVASTPDRRARTGLTTKLASMVVVGEKGWSFGVLRFRRRKAIEPVQGGVLNILCTLTYPAMAALCIDN